MKKLENGDIEYWSDLFLSCDDVIKLREALVGFVEFLGGYED